MESTQFVVDVTEATFQTEVLEASARQPVLLEFWAAWSEPCKTQAPALEALADAAGGAFRLARVDVDKNPQLTAYFRAQSIPMVLAIFQGQAVDQFSGERSETEIQAFVAGVFERCGLTLAVTEQAPTGAEDAEAHWLAILAADPEHAEALVALGRINLHRGDHADARALLTRVTVKMERYGEAQALESLMGLVDEVGACDPDAPIQQTDPPDAHYDRALVLAGRGTYGSALSALVGLGGGPDSPLRSRARAAAAIIFEVAGRGDEEVETQRRRMARQLF